MFALPEVKPTGAVLETEQDVVPAGQAIKITVICPTIRNPRVTVSQREAELGVATLKSAESKTFAYYRGDFDPKDASGVLCVTVWDEKGTPLAERLIYREPAKKMNIAITPDKKFFVPGDNVKLTVKTTDGDGKPVSGVVGLTVTDDSILEMIEKREQAPRLPVMVLLEPEVKDLADAHVYLDEKNPKAPLAVDLLLGTQGWRRFAFMDVERFIRDNGDNARRALALRILVEHERRKADRLAVERAAGEGGVLRGAVPPAPAGAPPPVQAAAAPKPQAAPARDAQVAVGEDKAAPAKLAKAEAPAEPPADAKANGAKKAAAEGKLQRALEEVAEQQDAAKDIGRFRRAAKRMEQQAFEIGRAHV
jgi:hypothetical protein